MTTAAMSAPGAELRDDTHRSDTPEAQRRPRFRVMALLGIADLAIDAIVNALALVVLGFVLFGIAWPVTQVMAPNYGRWAVFELLILLLCAALFSVAVIVLVWFLRGYAWVERHRTDAVYGTAIRPLPRRRTDRVGFRAFLHQWWLDASDSTPWRALGYLLLSSALVFVFGMAVLFGVGGGIAMCFVPLMRWQPGLSYIVDLPTWLFPLGGVVAILIGLAAAIGYGYIDRVMAKAILGVSDASVLRRLNDRLAEQRTGAVEAAADQRRRIERDLHDEVQPRLVSIAMTLGLAKGKLDADPSAAGSLLDEAHAATKDAITELRRLVQGFQPAVLADRGLDAALSAVVARCAVPTTLDAELSGPGCSAEAEAVIYFAVSEALTNVAKHARAGRCSVQVRHVDDRLVATITDDGVGGASIGPRSTGALPSGGLTGMQDRAVAAGGSVRIASPVGGPTTVTVEVPCAS